MYSNFFDPRLQSAGHEQPLLKSICPLEMLLESLSPISLTDQKSTNSFGVTSRPHESIAANNPSFTDGAVKLLKLQVLS